MSCLLQAKFYARSYGGNLNIDLKTDSDKMVVFSTADSLVILFSYMAIFYILYLIIAVLGTYSVSAGLHKLAALSKERSILLTIGQLDDLYWAAVVVCGVINITITTLDMRYFILLDVIYYKLQATVFLGIIEVICLLILSKDFKTTDSVCCFSHRHVLRVIHTLAWCQLVWFLHHVGCNLLVAIFFIAIAPAQTLAAITLLYSVLVCTVLFIAYNINSIRKYRRCCKRKCKLFLAYILYLCIIAFITLLTLIFNDLAENGLTSSGLGSIVLSLVAPTIVFIITLKLKRQLGSFFKPPEEVTTDIENPSTNTDNSPHDTDENMRLLAQ